MMFQQESMWREDDYPGFVFHSKESEPGFPVIIESLVYRGSFLSPLRAHEINEFVLLLKTAGSLFLMPNPSRNPQLFCLF